jgi:hypothetical protein
VVATILDSDQHKQFCWGPFNDYSCTVLGAITFLGSDFFSLHFPILKLCLGAVAISNFRSTKKEKYMYKKHSYQGKIPSHAGFGCRTSANQKTFLTLAAMLNLQMKRK